MIGNLHFSMIEMLFLIFIKGNYCRLYRSCILAVKATNWSDRYAIASYFILSLSLNDWFNSSSSSILLWISAPCLSSWCTFRNVRYGSIFLNISAFSDSFFVQYVEPEWPIKYSEKSWYPKSELYIYSLIICILYNNNYKHDIFYIRNKSTI